MKIRSLTVVAVLLGSMSVSLHADDDGGLRVIRVDDDKTKVGANFDNGVGLELFGVNAGLYGKSKQNNKSKQQMNSQQAAQSQSATPRQQRKAVRRNSTSNSTYNNRNQ